MKGKRLFSVVYIILGLLLILVPTVIFPVCESMEMKMSCYYSCMAEIILGIIVVVIGIVTLFVNDIISIVASVLQLLLGVLAIFFPACITGLCKMSDMDCRRQTFPGIIVVSVLLIAVSVVNIIVSQRYRRSFRKRTDA